MTKQVITIGHYVFTGRDLQRTGPRAIWSGAKVEAFRKAKLAMRAQEAAKAAPQAR